MDSNALRTRYLINAGLLGVLIVSLVIAYPFVMKAPSPYWQFMLAGVGLLVVITLVAVSSGWRIYDQRRDIRDLKRRERLILGLLHPLITTYSCIHPNGEATAYCAGWLQGYIDYYGLDRILEYVLNGTLPRVDELDTDTKDYVLGLVKKAVADSL